MKKFAFSLLLPMLMVSCNNETEDNYLDNNDNTNIEITIPMPDDMRTRGYSDGSRIDNLKCYVYAQSKGTSADPICIEDIVLHQYPDKIGSYWSLQLPKGQTYDLVFFATCGAHDNPAGKLYYDRNTRCVNVNYSSASNNDESFDCFFGSITNVSKDKGTSYSVTLKRPFAQLNIGTKDIGVYCDLKNIQKENLGIGVKVKGICTSFNAVDGSLQGDPKEVAFVSTAPPSNQSFPLTDNDYLAMDYLLVNDNIKTDATMTVDASGTKFDFNFSEVPLKRNCRTNIYGNLLTKTNDYKIEVNENYSGQDNTSVGLDLIIKLCDDYTPAMRHPAIYYKETKSGEYKKVDLTPYIGADKIIKASWEQLGIKKAYSVVFEQIDWSSNDYTHYESLMRFNFEDIGVQSFEELFSYCTYLKEINMENWDTSKIVNMRRMFGNCDNLENIDLSKLDTSSVTDMNQMFDCCRLLKALDLSNFDTSKVTDMGAMFASCNELETINLSSFDTSNVKDMRQMFMFCYELAELDLSNFNTSNATEMYAMFADCKKLEYLDLSNFDTSKVTSMISMFEECTNLKGVNVSSFDTSNVQLMSYMFCDDQELTSLDLSNFNTSKVTKMYGMFKGCKKLANLDISNFDYSKVTDKRYMFEGCTALGY